MISDETPVFGNIRSVDDAQARVSDAQAQDDSDLPATRSPVDDNPVVEHAARPPSEARQIANRLNATRSTGPRTLAGKEKSSKNATKHGLLSHALLPDEDAEDFDPFRDGYFQFYEPQGTVEEDIVERIVSYSWRLKRAQRAECQIYSQAAIMAAREHEERLRRDPPELMVTRERELTSAMGGCHVSVEQCVLAARRAFV
jgi:hypothetical protein